MGDCATRGQAKTKLAYAGTITNTSEYVTKDEVIAWGGDSSYLNKYISGNELVALEDIVKKISISPQRVMTVISSYQQAVVGFEQRVIFDVNTIPFSLILNFKPIRNTRNFVAEIPHDIFEVRPDTDQVTSLYEIMPYQELSVNIYIDYFSVAAVPVTGGTAIPIVSNRAIGKWSNALNKSNDIKFTIPKEYVNHSINIILGTHRAFEEVNNVIRFNDAMLQFIFDPSYVPDVTSLRVTVRFLLKKFDTSSELGVVTLKGDLKISENRIVYTNFVPFVFTGNISDTSMLVFIDSISVLGTPTAEGSGAGVGYNLGLTSLVFGYTEGSKINPIKQIDLGGVLSSDIKTKNVQFSVQNEHLKDFYLGFNVSEVQIN